MPFHKVHSYIEIERPIGLRRHDSSIHPEIVVALVEQAVVALALTGNVFHGSVRQARQVTECESIVDAERPVDPSPTISLPMEFEMLRITARHFLHKQLEQIPSGDCHVRYRLTPQQIFLNDNRL